MSKNCAHTSIPGANCRRRDSGSSKAEAAASAAAAAAATAVNTCLIARRRRRARSRRSLVLADDPARAASSGSVAGARAGGPIVICLMLSDSGRCRSLAERLGAPRVDEDFYPLAVATAFLARDIVMILFGFSTAASHATFLTKSGTDLSTCAAKAFATLLP